MKASKMYFNFKNIVACTIFIVTLMIYGYKSLVCASSIRPVSLRCEYRVNPKGIDVMQPRLSWLLKQDDPTFRRQKQTAYRVIVASNSEFLADGKGDLWDSGLVESDQNVHIVYDSKPLQSRAKCFWKVRVRDGNGKLSEWSNPAMWSMGILAESDWQGCWIGAKEQLDVTPREKLNGYHSQGSKSPDELKWVQVDLKEIDKIDNIVLHPALPMEHPNGQMAVRKPGFGFPLRFRIDISNDSNFKEFTAIADKTHSDYPDPGRKEIVFQANGLSARFVRVTATRLWDSQRGDQPYCFALGELQIFSGKKNISQNKPVMALDSAEG